MTALTMNAPWRAWHRFAKWIKNSRNVTPGLDQFPRDISDHLARDVGLSPHDVAQLRHEWPSRQPRHGL